MLEDAGLKIILVTFIYQREGPAGRLRGFKAISQEEFRPCQHLSEKSEEHLRVIVTANSAN